MNSDQGFFQLFAQGGGGTKYVSVCKVCGKLGESGSVLPWDFGTFITCNLVEFGTVFITLPFIVPLKLFKGLN